MAISSKLLENREVNGITAIPFIEEEDIAMKKLSF